MVARLAKDGLSNPEIGARLFISPGTAKYHLSNVYTKLGISSRNQLDRVLPVGQRAGGHGAETADARAAPKCLGSSRRHHGGRPSWRRSRRGAERRGARRASRPSPSSRRR
jgi:hypothetical protein